MASYTVSTSGNDSNNGTSAAWKTLQKAANVVLPGDNVTVLAGNYAGFQLTRSGTGSSRIAFQAKSGVVINQRNASTADGINLEGASFVTIDGFKVINTGRAGIRSVVNQGISILNNVCDSNNTWGILCGFSQNVLIEGNSCSNSAVQHGIYVGNSADNPIIRHNICFGNANCGIHVNADLVQGGDGIINNALVENNICYNNGRTGGSAINMDGVQNSIVQNNLLYDNLAGGIALFRVDGADTSKNNLIVNNTVVMPSAGRWCLNIQNGSTGNQVYNNILIHKNTARGSISISNDSLTGFKSNNNLVNDRFTTNDGSSIITFAQWKSQTGNDNNSVMVADSQGLFMDENSKNYHLAANSKAIDAGNNLGSATDSEGKSRTGLAADIGCYEFAGTTPPPDNIITSVVVPMIIKIGSGSITFNLKQDITTDRTGKILKIEIK
jgi:parallel beta-helix repeat protein